jgi:DNA repair exonuclease SbcCD ATPase subunit
MVWYGFLGGQRRTTDVLIMLAQGNLCNRLYGLENGILGVTFLDEIFAYLDQRYVDLLMHCTENTSSRLTVVITQDAAIKNMIDQTLVVTKKAGVGSQYRFVNVEQ